MPARDGNWPGLDWPVRRIFCIGRNYAGHARELGNAIPAEPVVFMKPPASLVPPGGTIRLPQGSGAVHHEAEMVLALDGRGGIRGVTLGLDLTLRELQARLKQAGQPWERAKAFDCSAPLGNFIPARDLDPDRLEFHLHVNGALRQQGATRDMLFSCTALLEFLARYWRPVEGDIVFTGTPAGVGPVLPGDTLRLGGAAFGEFEWHCGAARPQDQGGRNKA